MPTKPITVAVGAVLGSLALAACDIDVPDLNNPGLDQLENNSTLNAINTACTGLLIGTRATKSGTTGLVNQLGILGRESYTFDSADTRFVSEELEQDLQKTSAFGGIFWQVEYSYIRLANIILHGVDKVPEFGTADGAPLKAGIQGFAHTIQAFELLTVIVTHDATGAVIDTDRPLGADLAPIVD